MPASDASEAAEAIVTKLFHTAEGRSDPYPLYHQLREASPVHKTGMGMWVLSRYDDCWAAMRDPRFGKDYPAGMAQRFGADWRTHPALVAGEISMLNVGGPEHTRLRKLVAKAFTPRMIERLRPSIESTVLKLLEPIADAGGGDVLAAVGFPLPVTIIGELLGVPAADRPQFHHLVIDLTAIFEMQPAPEALAAADVAQLEIERYFLDLIAEKRRNPREDLLSGLANASVDGDRLNDDELVVLASLLFAAGFETTTNLFGNGLLGLLQHPDQIDRLRQDESLFANVPDELLRYDGTAQLVNRVTETAVEIGDVTIPAGEQVFALLGAGNHDPARFPDPDRLDVTRTDIQPVSFGGGVHFCLGAALARAEIEITFRSLLGRFDSIEVSAEPRFRDRLTLRGLHDLHVSCRATGTARPASGAAPAAAAAGAPKSRAPASGGRGLRPSATDRHADLRWRADLRQRIENEPTRADSLPLSTGTKLAATVALLSRNSFFQKCAQAELEMLAATAYPMSFEPGDMLCVEGAESPEAYVIATGQVVVSIERKGVATLEEDDIVGERGVLLDTARAATVTAISHVITVALSRERLRAVVDANPTLRQWMVDEMKRRYPNLD